MDCQTSCTGQTGSFPGSLQVPSLSSLSAYFRFCHRRIARSSFSCPPESGAAIETTYSTQVDHDPDACAAVSVTIPSGALAERCQFRAYLLYTFWQTCLIYPMVVHWVWSHEVRYHLVMPPLSLGHISRLIPFRSCLATKGADWVFSAHA